MSARLEDYAVIGDCETAALVSRDGSIDWLCWPRFDSEACFAALLGDPRHGRWLIAPCEPTTRISRRYRPDTLILETEFATRNGAIALVDFMPPRAKSSNIVRMVRGIRGRVAVRIELIMRFGYGRAVPWVERLPDGRWRAIAGPDLVVLHTPVSLEGKGLTTVGEFHVGRGETVWFVLTYGPSHLPPPDSVDPEHAYATTEAFWTDWVSRNRPQSEFEAAVTRSLITLKALTYAPTGGMVAAPTTSLPEQVRGTRNWDYRYCWLRDATLTLLALMNAGYHDEARAWRDWLLRAAAGSPDQTQIMYGLAGERRLPEIQIAWLPGYEGAQPVRVGNLAHQQIQLDVFGEVMDALHQARIGGIAPLEDAWAFQCKLLEHLETVWQSPDHGIWEIRGEPRQFTYSKVMAWLAFERGITAAHRFGLAGPVEHWRAARDAIHREVCARGFDTQRGTFVQSYGSKELDASLLLLPTIGFLPVTDSRMRGTIAAIEQDLLVDGLVRRYDTSRFDDGLPEGEGAFLACTFWLADAYVLSNRVEDARRLFLQLLRLRNDVGLLAEEYDTRLRRLVGNFPQAFSHIALLTTAHNLVQATQPAQQHASRCLAAPA